LTVRILLTNTISPQKLVGSHVWRCSTQFSAK
jgi:hypothetical protein